MSLKKRFLTLVVAIITLLPFYNHASATASNNQTYNLVITNKYYFAYLCATKPGVYFDYTSHPQMISKEEFPGFAIYLQDLNSTRYHNSQGSIFPYLKLRYNLVIKDNSSLTRNGSTTVIKFDPNFDGLLAKEIRISGAQPSGNNYGVINAISVQNRVCYIRTQ